MKRGFAVALMLVLGIPVAMAEGSATAPAGGEEAADGETASREAVLRLLEVADMQRLTGMMNQRMKRVMREGMQRQLAGEQLNAEQRRILEKMQGEIVALVEERMDWQKMRPWVVEVYSSNLTEREVAALTEFYRTPEGRSTMQKLPRIMEAVMRRVQQTLREVMPEIRRIQQDAIERARAAD